MHRNSFFYELLGGTCKSNCSFLAGSQRFVSKSALSESDSIVLISFCVQIHRCASGISSQKLTVCTHRVCSVELHEKDIQFWSCCLLVALFLKYGSMEVTWSKKTFMVLQCSSRCLQRRSAAYLFLEKMNPLSAQALTQFNQGKHPRRSCAC